MTSYLQRFITIITTLTLTAAVQAQTKLPYRQAFDDVSDFETFLVADENNDNATWIYDDIMQAAKCERNYNADDWLITPVFELEKGNTYKLTFTTYTELESTETIEIFMGNGRRVSALTTNIMATTQVATTTPKTLTAIFVADETDDYRIGFHHSTKNDPYFNYLYIDNITLEETVSQSAPAPVTDLSVAPGERGALTATITLRTPELTIDQQPLSELSKVELFRDNHLIHTFDAPAPGTMLTYNDTEGITNGSHLYKAVASNVAGSSSPTETNAYIGIDVPGPVENLHFTYDHETGHATVTWDAPTKGAHGGYIDTSDLRYSLRKYPMSSGKTLGAPISDTRFEEDFDIEWLTAAAEERYRETEEQFHYPVARTLVIDGQGMTYYIVKAISDIGESQEATSERHIIGEPYKLPFEESFANAMPTHFWHKPVTEMRNRWYEIADSRYAQDGDNGFLAYSVTLIEGGNTSIEDTAMAQSGRLDLTGATTPVISLYYRYLYAMSHPLLVKVSDDGVNFRTVGEIDTSDETKTDQYIRAIVPLTGINNPKGCYVALEATLGNTAELLYVDNISIYDQHEYDLAAHLGRLPSHLRSGESRHVEVEVSNIGEHDVEAGAYDVEVYVAGQLCGNAVGSAVKVGETITVDVEATATANMPVVSPIFARVVYAADQINNNDQSASADIKVKHPSYPVPQQLAIAEGTTTLQWKAPQPPRSEDETITDSFEEYADFTISDLGDWVLVDGDNHLTYSWGENYNWPNRTQPHAFIVMTPAEVDLPNTGGKGLSASWQAHSGQKMLMSSSSNPADDWLISPELSGKAQTITFYARGTNSYTEKMDVCYSTTDTEVGSFTRIGQTNSFKSAEWKRYTYQLPEGSRHFAIHNVSEDGSMLFVDDATFVPETLARQDITLLGYNVYCNGEQLNEALVTATTFTDSQERDGATYTVTAVYDKGESASSNEAQTASGISETSLAPAGNDTLYDLMGRRTNGQQKGIYIRSGKKIIVK